MAVATSAAADLADLSLEELLDTELEQMAISDIHHTHERGEWMVGYSFMYMEMDGNRDGTKDRSAGSVIADGFPVTPTDMSMEMHMFHVMYGITDKLTVMVMVPYIRKAMNHLRMDGLRPFQSTVSGELRGERRPTKWGGWNGWAVSEQEWEWMNS